MVTPAPRPYRLADAILLQRLEGVAAVGLALAAYGALEQSWLIFALLLLAPDLAMLGYLQSTRLGTLTYNLGHSYAGPALLALLGLLAGPTAYGLAAIWLAHIGMDRALGYGLKTGTGFEQTHLGAIGKARRALKAAAQGRDP